MNEVLESIRQKLAQLATQIPALSEEIALMPDDRYSAQKMNLVLRRDRLVEEQVRLTKLKTVLEAQ